MKKSILCLVLISAMFSGMHKLAAQQKAVNILVYTSPDRWHNPSIPTAVNQLEKMVADKQKWGITWTQQEERFTDEFLEEFTVIIFLHATSRNFSKEQMNSIKKFIRSGGGFVGIHAASTFGSGNEDPWYEKLIGYRFTTHPKHQTAILTVQDRNHPSTMHMNDHEVWTEEWYNFEGPLKDSINVVLTVEGSTFVNNVEGDGPLPIAWYQYYDGGRSFYTALGHIEENYTYDLLLKHLYGAIYWAATGMGILKEQE